MRFMTLPASRLVHLVCVAAPSMLCSATTMDAGEHADADVSISAPSHEQALHAAQVTLNLIPGDDIEHGFRPTHVRVSDLDGDGRAEVIYTSTSTYTGGSMERQSAVSVMTALTKDDKRARGPAERLPDVVDEYYAAIRASGFADDAAVHVPGVIKELDVAGSRITVTFESLGDSAYCHAKMRREAGLPGCPAPGEHTWTWRWSPGRLTSQDVASQTMPAR